MAEAEHLRPGLEGLALIHEWLADTRPNENPSSVEIMALVRYIRELETPAGLVRMLKAADHVELIRASSLTGVWEWRVTVPPSDPAAAAEMWLEGLVGDSTAPAALKTAALALVRRAKELTA